MSLRIVYVGILLGVAFTPVNCLQKNSTFIMENKKTRMVAGLFREIFRVSEWENTDKQLWLLEEEDKSGHYVIRNVANRWRIVCAINGERSKIWKLNILNYTRILMGQLAFFVGIDPDNSMRCNDFQSFDGSDEWLLIEWPRNINTTFVIENMKTGKVLEEVEASLKVKSWKDVVSQLWTLMPQNKSGYSIVNVASGNILTYNKNGIGYQTWRLETYGSTRIQLEHFSVFLAQKNGEPFFVIRKLGDDSDKWTLTDPESMKNRKPNRIFVDDYKEEFVIKNRKTTKVLDASNLIEEYTDQDTQLWILEPQNKSRFYIIRNLGDGSVLSYTKYGEVYQTWKLNINGYTRIQLEATNLFLADDDGRAIAAKRRHDRSDRWLIVERSLKKSKMKPKRIYINPENLVK